MKCPLLYSRDKEQGDPVTVESSRNTLPKNFVPTTAKMAGGRGIFGQKYMRL